VNCTDDELNDNDYIHMYIMMNDRNKKKDKWLRSVYL